MKVVEKTIQEILEKPLKLSLVWDGKFLMVKKIDEATKAAIHCIIGKDEHQIKLAAHIVDIDPFILNNMINDLEEYLDVLSLRREVKELREYIRQERK